MILFDLVSLMFLLQFFIEDCITQSSDHTACTVSTCFLPDESTLRFFIIGDWGGLPVWPYHTSAQRRVARAMATMGYTERTHFQISLGDHVYTLGAKSVNDTRFYKTFEMVYYEGSALFKPWYMIAGNHDYYGDIQAQLDYTKISNRWVFPDLYYTVKYALSNNLTIDIIMIDTIILCGNTKEGKYKTFIAYFLAPSSDRETQGPKDPVEAEKQWQWLESQLANSTADYLFVAGHYPVYSSGEHGPTPCLVRRLNPLLHKYKVNGYFSGHDHGMEHLAEKIDDWTVHHVLSGAGALEMQSDKRAYEVPSDFSLYHYPTNKWLVAPGAAFGIANGAFVYAEVKPEHAMFHYVLGDLTPEHVFSMSPRPKSD